MADSVAYRCGFVDWADGEFHELEMPWEIVIQHNTSRIARRPSTRTSLSPLLSLTSPVV
jgi:hypothetical protein